MQHLRYLIAYGAVDGPLVAAFAPGRRCGCLWGLGGAIDDVAY
ncbi:hypothetical protein [Vreelandella venusta]